MKKTTIAILGAGSWGTAVAIHLANCGNRVLLWGHRVEHVQDMKSARCNQRFLPKVTFPANLNLESNIDVCLKSAALVIIAVPSHAFAEILTQLPQSLSGLAWLTKGVDPSSHKLLSELVSERWATDFPIAVISGPSFAREVAQFLPTALTIAGNNSSYSESLRDLFHHNNIRTYLSDDVIGVQLCGAVKNVLAIACGISDGMNYGANAKAALITRGLAEMSRLGTALGAKPETFMGLAGVGDLVLTCTDDQSRNRRFGLKLGQGLGLQQAEDQIGQVVEGKHNAAQICALASQYQVEMPICNVVNSLIQGNITTEQAVLNLMSRPPKEE
jgi:glycerol-3-phosphate dehydrogenase (NAD(P)+)